MVTHVGNEVTSAAVRVRSAIAAIGECLIDFTPVERAGVLTGFDMHPGG